MSPVDVRKVVTSVSCACRAASLPANAPSASRLIANPASPQQGIYETHSIDACWRVAAQILGTRKPGEIITAK